MNKYFKGDILNGYDKSINTTTIIHLSQTKMEKIMKVYIVKAPQGEYENYSEPIVKVFLDKSKAESYVEEENAKLPLEQAKKCEECHYKWKMCFKSEQPIPKCLQKDKYDTCENYFKYSGINPLFIEEHEVEE